MKPLNVMMFKVKPATQRIPTEMRMDEGITVPRISGSFLFLLKMRKTRKAKNTASNEILKS